MGVNDAQEMLEAAQDECIRLERELALTQAGIAAVFELTGDIGPEARRILTELPASTLARERANAWDDGVGSARYSERWAEPLPVNPYREEADRG